MKTFERTRPIVGAMAVGVARAAYEYALNTPANESNSVARSANSKRWPSSWWR